MTATDVLQIIRMSLPAKATQIDWQNPQLFIAGTDWTLAVMTPWRVLYQDRLLFGSDDVEAAAVAKIFEGNLITQCLQQSSTSPLDPSLVFASGHVLEIFSVGPLEPWIFSSADGRKFISSPSE